MHFSHAIQYKDTNNHARQITYTTVSSNKLENVPLLIVLTADTVYSVRALIYIQIVFPSFIISNKFLLLIN